jgi:quercetin dioxygenase-like cupin family protein
MTADSIVPIADGEAVLRGEREVCILLTREEVTITHARYPGGEQVAGPHVHHEHTDAFFVLEGGLTFQVGGEDTEITVSAGDFVAAPPLVAHSFRTTGDRPARWLTIHARDGGFGAFMRGIRDGVEAEWDIAPVPSGGGLPASAAVVTPGATGESPEPGSRLMCALSDISVAEWHLNGANSEPSFPQGGEQVHSIFVIEGEVEATLEGGRRTVGPGTLISGAPGARFAIDCPGSAWVLSLHTPDAGFADRLVRV